MGITIKDERKDVEYVAYSMATAYYAKDLLTREWSTIHGGVYVPVSDFASPNPYLDHIEYRDIYKPDGTLLTLINPAYMLRQMNEMTNDRFGIFGHITSLNPLRPANKPDEWESNALVLFDEGVAEEVFEYSSIDNVAFFRFMKPLYTEQGCLKCHSIQGYQIGDIRGGISISIPMDDLFTLLNTNIRQHIFTHVGLWVFGVLILLISYLYSKRYEEYKTDMMKKIAESQKMETVGRLAGGIAHDFNNLLTPLLGYSELIMNYEVDETHPIYEPISDIYNISIRAKRLVQQLLMFSRKNVLDISVCDLNNLIENIIPIIKRTIRENIVIELDLDPNLMYVSLDVNQFEMVLLNLSINAQDAMQDGGTIIIKTANICINQDSISDNKKIPKGTYSLLSFSDSGVGIPDDVQKRIFEPFFTTKAPGKGTGLGLSTVKSIVEQMNAKINVYSQIGNGTVFKIYIPVADKNQVENFVCNIKPDSAYPRGTETVLFVEDDAFIMKMIPGMLQRIGYQVLTAKNVRQAREIIKNTNDHIDVLVSDVVMPDGTGFDIYHFILNFFPEIKVLFISGYINLDSYRNEANIKYRLLSKPFSMHDLSVTLREVLDSTDHTTI